jgi:methyl-accepting chemotaxis protein
MNWKIAYSLSILYNFSMINVKDYSMQTRFLMMGITLVITVSLLSGVVLVRTLKTQAAEELRVYREDTESSIKKTLKNYVGMAADEVDSIYSSVGEREYLIEHYGTRLEYLVDMAEEVVSQYVARARGGALSTGEAQRRAMAEIGALRYDSGVGYFWINDLSYPYPKMLMHPVSPALNGHIMDSTKYDVALGKKENLFTAMVDVTRESGEGYVDYLWPKPTEKGTTEDQPKLSYVRRIPEWGWIIGTGIYVDDARKDAISDALTQVRNLRYDNGVGYFWINDRGKPYPRMIMHPVSPQLDGTVLDDPKYNVAQGTNKNLFQAFVDVADAQGGGFVDYQWPKPTADGITEDQPKLSYVELYEPLGWIIGTGVYTDDIDKAIAARKIELDRKTRDAIIQMTAVLFAVVLVGSVVILFSVRRITTPLKIMITMLRDLNQGQGDLTRRINVATRDEIGTMAGLNNEFIGRLSLIVTQIKDVAENINSGGYELSSNSTETSVAIGEISSNLVSIGSQVAGLDNEISRSRGNISQMSSSTDSLTRQADEVARTVSEITGAFREMGSQMASLQTVAREQKNSADSLVTITEEGGLAITESNSILQDMEKSTDKILEIVDIIDDVSSRTNLLSMNAAIEAAHAGDAGKGFAVVAEEIRGLSVSTSDSARDITLSLKSLVEKIRSAADMGAKSGTSFQRIRGDVAAASDALDKIHRDLDDFSRQTGEALSSLEGIDRRAENVRKFTNTISGQTGDLDGFMDQVGRMSGSVRQGIEEIVTGIGEITKAISRIAELARVNQEASAVLVEQMGQFKTEE